jgi:UDP-N-acetylglucosamine acyltransferase
MMDIHAILKQLPHRYPFLLVDKVLELERNQRIRAIKNVTFNEPYFMGHFPGRPVMPGVLILEALAQAAGLLAFDAMGQVPDENNIYYFVGIDGARFKRPVEPGDQLILDITIDRVRGGSAVSHVHPTAVVDAQACIDERASIGPFAVIGPHVRIGAGTTVGAHCVIDGHTTIGQDNRIYPFASLGAAPQDKKYGGEPTELRIGDRNTIREFCTFNTGTAQDKGSTTIGNDNWIMAYVHIAHDCVVGDHTTMANNATLAGHVEVGDWATIGGLTGVLQRMRIGAHTMVGFSSHVGKDVPPFMVVDGNPLAVRGVNLVGLRRRDFSDQRISAIREMHKLLYRQGLTLEQARAAMAQLPATHPEAAQDVALMDAFLASSVAGIAR